MKLNNSKTMLNLAKSFAGECQAQVRYKFIAYGAEQAGYCALAKIIDTIIIQEFNHARMFYTFIQEANDCCIENIDICSGYPFKEKWNLLDNLKLASEDESNEASKIYPEYEKVARAEGFTEIANLYQDIIQVENCHKMLFEDLHKQLKDGSLYRKPEVVKWKCADCGYEEEAKQAFDICPLCKAKQGAVMLKVAN